MFLIIKLYKLLPHPLQKLPQVSNNGDIPAYYPFYVISAI